MKKVGYVLLGIVLLWFIYIGVEYFSCYYPDETSNKLLLTIDKKESDEKVIETGLGISIVRHNLNVTESENGTVVKEFKIFGLTVSKTTIERDKK